MTSTPTQTKRLTLLSTTFDPRDPRTHSQLVRVAISPFASGRWHLEYEQPSSSVGRFQPARVNLRWSGCTDSTLRRARLAVAVGDESHASTGVLQVDGPGNGGWSLAVGRPTRECTVVLEIEPDEIPSSATLLPVERCLPLIDGPGAIDLCLTFAGDSRKLWASSAVLARVSPWWATYVTSSGYYESSISHAATPAERADWDDSDCSEDDDEDGRGDSIHSQLHRSAAAALSLDTPPPSPPIKLRDLPSWCRVVPIQGTSYRTYRAFLAWVLTGSEIEFAPLTSSFRFTPFDPRKASAATTASSSATSAVPSRCASPAPGRKAGVAAFSSSSAAMTNGIAPSASSQAKKRRAAALAPFSRLYPSRPKPVSPKSLYRLAHFLDIPALQSICLAALKQALTPETVAYEVFDDPMAEVYDEVVRAEVEFAVANWQRVKSSKAMKVVQERMLDEGATMYELRTLFRLSGLN
ncbi:hypothetical protein JCM10908_004647 [Rhodotorula pacifica]|uniref:uncharacterized protein n=1 Tax=Rhodotorula pacifica TaxID=1495444 RepID=UPI0031751F99